MPGRGRPVGRFSPSVSPWSRPSGVDVLGPAALATQRILAHWAAQTGGLRGVTEDELLAEGRLVGDEDWQSQLALRGTLSPAALAEKLEG